MPDPFFGEDEELMEEAIESILMDADKWPRIIAEYEAHRDEMPNDRLGPNAY